MNRWEVRMTHPSPKERDVITHTWGETREDAQRRVTEIVAEHPELYFGWSLVVAQEPTH